MKLKILAGAALVAAACACLSGCGGLGGVSLPGGSGSAASSALHDFLTDPSCSHHDEAIFVTGAGGLPASFQAKVLRDCAAKPAQAPAAVSSSTSAAP